MKSSELRIGNWIYPNEENATPYPVVELLESDIISYRSKNIHIYDEDVIIPYFQAVRIELNEKWLKGYGFKYYEENDSYQLVVKLGFSIWGRIKTGFNVYVESTEIGKSIKYVHQLQNLYFALTGKELDCSLTKH